MDPALFFSSFSHISSATILDFGPGSTAFYALVSVGSLK